MDVAKRELEPGAREGSAYLERVVADKAYNKIGMPDAFLNCNPDVLWINLSIVHLAVPDAECCTGR